MSFIKIETRLSYNPKLNQRAKDMRKNMTAPEKKIWFLFFQKINSWEIKVPQSSQTSPSIEGESWAWVKQGEKIRVYRQRPIQNFIVDFYIPKYKLVIEIDGESHFDENGRIYDEERSDILQGLGLQVLRFTNEEVMKNFSWVCQKIMSVLE